MASRFASREFYPFAESKVNIWDWLFTGVVYTKIVIPLGVPVVKYPRLFTSTSVNNCYIETSRSLMTSTKARPCTTTRSRIGHCCCKDLFSCCDHDIPH